MMCESPTWSFPPLSLILTIFLIFHKSILPICLSRRVLFLSPFFTFFKKQIFHFFTFSRWLEAANLIHGVVREEFEKGEIDPQVQVSHSAMCSPYVTPHFAHMSHSHFLPSVWPIFVCL